MGGGAGGPGVAVFRPADERIETAGEVLRSLGAEPVADPMLEVDPTGAVPAAAPLVVFTSKTGVELAAEAGWGPGDADVAAIGPGTAAAGRQAGWAVEHVPEESTPAGRVAALRSRVAGERGTVARAGLRSDAPPDGLRDDGAGAGGTGL